MATQRENKDIAELQKNVAVMQTDIKYIARGQDEIKNQISKMSFVPQSEHDKLEARVRELEEYNSNNKVGTVFSNLLASKAFTFVIGLIFAAMLYYLVKTGGK